MVHGRLKSLEKNVSSSIVSPYQNIIYFVKRLAAEHKKGQWKIEVVHFGFLLDLRIKKSEEEEQNKIKNRGDMSIQK